MLWRRPGRLRAAPMRLPGVVDASGRLRSGDDFASGLIILYHPLTYFRLRTAPELLNV